MGRRRFRTVDGRSGAAPDRPRRRVLRSHPRRLSLAWERTMVAWVGAMVVSRLVRAAGSCKQRRSHWRENGRKQKPRESVVGFERTAKGAGFHTPEQCCCFEQIRQRQQANLVERSAEAWQIARRRSGKKSIRVGTSYEYCTVEPVPNVRWDRSTWRPRGQSKLAAGREAWFSAGGANGQTAAGRSSKIQKRGRGSRTRAKQRERRERAFGATTYPRLCC